MLDIIMPHYDEPWEIGKPFFDMLACQRGIDFDKVKVILVNDGTGMLNEKLFREYPFKVEQHNIKHKGVSAARNFGMDLSTAEWITFCDFDDRYSSVYSLKYVFDVLDTEEYDMLWNPFYVENYDKNKNFVLTQNEKFNMVWIHNKYFRRKVMVEHDLRFNENLYYCEDSGMLAIFNCEVDIRRIGKIKSPTPLYIWIYRKGSATLNEDLKLQNMVGYFERNKYVTNSFMEMNHIDKEAMCGRTLTDAYFSLTRADLPDGWEELEKGVCAFFKEHKKDLQKLTPDIWQRVIKASMKEAIGNNYFNPDRPLFGDWLKGLEEKYV